MGKTTPANPRGTSNEEAEQRSSLRERVRQHMLKMAPLALVAAAPITNTACDCVPELPPACQQLHWETQVSARARWALDHGSRIVILDLGVTDAELQISPSYTISGGAFLTVGKSDQLKIKPDEGATMITLHGSMTCGDGYGPRDLTITIDLVPPDGGSADADPTVKVP